MFILLSFPLVLVRFLPHGTCARWNSSSGLPGHVFPSPLSCLLPPSWATGTAQLLDRHGLRLADERERLQIQKLKTKPWNRGLCAKSAYCHAHSKLWRPLAGLRAMPSQTLNLPPRKRLDRFTPTLKGRASACAAARNCSDGGEARPPNPGSPRSPQLSRLRLFSPGSGSAEVASSGFQLRQAPYAKLFRLLPACCKP